MTRLPKIELNDSSDPLIVDSEEPWMSQLKDCIAFMREWTSPDSEGVCSQSARPYEAFAFQGIS